MYLKRQKLDVALHSLLSEYKNVQESVLTIFLTAASFADVCIFSVPPPSLGIVSVPAIGGIYTDYQRLIFTGFTFCVGK